MDICYVDESGSSDLLCTKTPASTPVLVVAGLIVPGGHLKDLVWGFLQIKKRFTPTLTQPAMRLSDVIASEVKGADLRSDFRSGARRPKRRAIGIVDSIFDLLEGQGCRLVARVVAKDVDRVIDDRTVYGSSISWICSTFHRFLEERDGSGLVVLDSRTKVKNTPNADVVTTQVFRHGGDRFPRLVEVPVFGHSDSHVALQIADILVSAVVFPAACSAFCGHLTWNHHSHASYDDIRVRYGKRLKDLQFRYFDAETGSWKGGIWANGPTSPLSASKMFVGSAPSPVLPGMFVAPSIPPS